MEQGQKWHLASRLPYNILRKEFLHAFCESQVRPGQQIGGAAVHPCRMNEKRREDIGSSCAV